MCGVWATFYEMATAQPVIPGSIVEKQLHFIFAILQTPAEELWPGILSK